MQSQSDFPYGNQDKETYLGDGVYASFDGYQICLRAKRGITDDYIYLDANLYTSLIGFVNEKVYDVLFN